MICDKCGCRMIHDRPDHTSDIMKCPRCYRRKRSLPIEEEVNEVIPKAVKRVFTTRIRVKGKEIYVKARAFSEIEFQRYIAVRYYGLLTGKD